MNKLTEVRAVLCEREKEQMEPKDAAYRNCDGRTVVCGKCDHTARLILSALEERASQTNPQQTE